MDKQRTDIASAGKAKAHHGYTATRRISENRKGLNENHNTTAGHTWLQFRSQTRTKKTEGRPDKLFQKFCGEPLSHGRTELSMPWSSIQSGPKVENQFIHLSSTTLRRPGERPAMALLKCINKIKAATTTKILKRLYWTFSMNI